MADSVCAYDCSDQPTELTSNPEIAGIGVSMARPFLQTAQLVC